MSFSFFQITRRYAEFSAAIVSLNESFPDEKVRIIKFNSLTVTSFLILFCTLGEKFPVVISSINQFFFKVNKVLAALQVEVENFILRMAAEFPLRKEQLIFLINNYDMMLAVLLVCFTQEHPI